jgi:hypothetical protein
MSSASPEAARSDVAGVLGLLGPGTLANPYPMYEMLHGAGSTVFMPGLFQIGAWVIGSHSACSQILRSKSFGKEGHKVLLPEVLARLPQEAVELAERRRNSMLFRDPPDHTRLRGLVSQAFTPRIVERLRPHIAEIAEQLIDAMESRGTGRADLIADFGFPLPIIVIAELLGVPPADRDQFKAWSTELTHGLRPDVTPALIQSATRAVQAMDTYLEAVIEERRRAPRADLISELVSAQSEGDKLTMAELTTTCRLILTAGHETTVNLIGNGMLALLQNPAARAELAAEPTLLPNAVEELLRYDSPVQMTMRFSYQDTPVGSHTIKRGDVVITVLGAANRDPAQFPEPNRLDLRRENAHTHLSFGQGIHYCLGASLARLEGALALSALLRRLPRLALAEQPLSWRSNPVLRGLTSLPVTL